MKISKRKNKKYIILTAAILITATAILGFIYLKKTQTTENPTLSTERSTEPDNTQISKANESKNSSSDTKKEIKNIEGPDPQTSEKLSGTITYGGVVGQMLVIRTNIDQFITEGSCNLKLSNNTAVIEKQSTLVTNPSSSTCDGFNVPLVELSNGDWDIEITVSGNNKSGTIKGKVSI